MRLVALPFLDGRAFPVLRKSTGLSLEMVPMSRSADSVPTSSGYPTGSLTLLAVVPSPLTLPTSGSPYQMQAIGYDSYGNRLSITPTWSIVEAGTAASINSSTGVVTPGATAETITVRATVGPLSADADVTIAAITIDSLVISPDSWTLAVNQTRTFTATGYAGATPVAVSPTWSKVSGVGSIAASTGVYTAGTTSGSAVLRATVGSVTADVTVTVTRGTIVSIAIAEGTIAAIVGQPATATLVGEDAYGNLETFETDLGTVTWTAALGCTLVSNYNTATITAFPVLVETTYNNAIQVSWNGLVAFADLVVQPEGA